ncbi:uncharacterized protein EV420DRAFT_1075917 [Desarmillaria tabescens]|uniref:Mid2 domain-containing protein n=1 Tax=Armillaria tabescens TaxID=1929756 RepID=A0AA39JHX1_ARMTA|nr:uncharacterized protein EV420DRAFT_1075917 [Desarmillaria tabescens]KAK0442482.1 hypothetical protein EV420DRAFT_1075917 [Desarmillaria tabescens]
MVDAPFHAISTLALASFSLALQIQVVDENHILQGQNTTVFLIHTEGDPTDVFLKKHRLANNSNKSNDVVKVTNFTSNTTVNVNFNHSNQYEIYAYGNGTIDPSGKNAIATSDVFEVHNPDQGASSHHSHHGSDKGLIVGAVLGSTALIIIILLTIYLIFFRSRRRQRFQDRLVRHSDTPASSFVQYLYAKYPPGRKSGSASYRDSPPPVYARSSPTSARISLARSMTTNSIPFFFDDFTAQTSH